MNWAWASSLDQIWRSPTFPMWLTLAAAGFFGIIVLITLLRAEKSVANGALTVITLLAIAVAVAATIREFGPGGQGGSPDASSPQAMNVTLPALACVDDLAGDAVLNACEKALFGSAESSAAAVSYAASQITRLTAFGDVATANKNMTPELQALRRAVEHDRYGLMAYALMARDHCTPSDCAAFRALTDSHQIAANMDERVYEGAIVRYASTWNAPPPSAPAPVAALIPGVPTGRPTNAEFPTAASTPPVSIMTPEPVAKPPAPKPPVATAAAPVPLSPPPGAPAATLAAAKKPPAPKPPRAAAPASAPVSIAPPQAPAASND
ncbi:MAG: hypothetical protein WDN50_21080 [Bradyrhizobium sp.]